MQIAPPIVLLPYVDFKNGKVVPAKQIPQFLEKKFEQYCKDFEEAKRQQQQKIHLLTE